MTTKDSKPKTARPPRPRKARTAAAPPATALHRVRFACTRPEASEVFLAGTFNQWHPSATPMLRGEGGAWAVEMELPAGVYEYRFIVDGHWQPDPAARETTVNPFGGVNSVLRLGAAG